MGAVRVDQQPGHPPAGAGGAGRHRGRVPAGRRVGHPTAPLPTGHRQGDPAPAPGVPAGRAPLHGALQGVRVRRAGWVDGVRERVGDRARPGVLGAGSAGVPAGAVPGGW